MRIVVVGDFHIHTDELDLTEHTIEDINGCEPDLVIPLGDFGSNALIGSVDGLGQAYHFLGRIKAPMRPILGNHDLQRESGNGRQRKGTMEQKLRELFQLDAANGVIEGDHYRLFFVGTDPQPSDSCYQVQECYVTDKHFAALSAKLKERPEVPVIFFTHAPPAGAALRTVPRVHVRASNAYLDQNHQFERWNELIRNHPQIVMWFSAHYHLGQHYPDSMTVRYGVRFVHTGVHGSCTRDGNRQSRVIDIDPVDGNEPKVKIYTLDHVTRRIREHPDWSGLLQTAVQADSVESINSQNPKGSRMYGAAPGNHSEEPTFDKGHRVQFGARLLASYPIGEGAVIPGGIVSLDPERCLAATEDGFLWETLHRLEAVMGTLHYGQRLQAVLWTEEGVWRAWENKIAYTNPANMDRFVCEWQEEDPANTIQLPEPIGALAPSRDGGVWAACGQTLLKVGKADVTQLYETGEYIVKLIPDGEQVVLLTRQGKLIRYSPSNSRFTARQMDDVDGVWVDWELFRGEEIGVYSSNGSYFARISTQEVDTLVPLSVRDKQPSPSKPDPSSCSIKPLRDSSESSELEGIQALLLGSGYYLILLDGVVYIGHGGQIEALGNHDSAATAIARMPASSGIRFCVTLKADGPIQRPLVQVWELPSLL